MGTYNLSGRAQFDLVAIYKYGIKIFGQKQAVEYLYGIEYSMLELAARPELARDSSALAHNLKHYNYRAHVIFYQFERDNEIYIVRIMGKRMNFMAHF